MRRGRSCIKRLTFAKLNFTPKNLISIASLATVASNSVQKILYEAPHVSKPVFVVSPYLSFSFMETGFSKSQGIIKALPSLDSSSLIKLMQFKVK